MRRCISTFGRETDLQGPAETPLPLQALRASLASQGPKDTTFLETHINLPETRLLACDKPLSLKEDKYYVIGKSLCCHSTY